MYASLDGIASLVTGWECTCNESYVVCREHFTKLANTSPADANCPQCKKVLKSVLQTCGEQEFFRCPNCDISLSVKNGLLVDYVDLATESSDDEDGGKKQRKLLSHPQTKGTFAVVKTHSLASRAAKIIGDAKHDKTEEYNWYCHSIKRSDLYRLGPGRHLNDDIINLYLLFLAASAPNDDVHVVSTHFWKRALDESGNYDFSAVANWTRSLRKKFFHHRVVLFPRHEPGNM